MNFHKRLIEVGHELLRLELQSSTTNRDPTIPPTTKDMQSVFEYLRKFCHGVTSIKSSNVHISVYF